MAPSGHSQMPEAVELCFSK